MPAWEDGEKWPPPFSGRTMRSLLMPGRRKMAVVRLGKRGWRGRRILAGLLRRMRLRWLATKYREAIKRIRTCQVSLVRDAMEGVTATEAAAHSRLMVEAYFAGPFLPVTTISCRPAYY